MDAFNQIIMPRMVAAIFTIWMNNGNRTELIINTSMIIQLSSMNIMRCLGKVVLVKYFARNFSPPVK